MTAAKQWSGEAIETVLAAQGIRLAPGRAERVARGLQAFLGPSMADPLREALELDAVPPCYARAQERCKAE